MPTKSALSGARRVDVTGFGVPEHHGDSSALPMIVRSGNLSLEIWSSGEQQAGQPRSTTDSKLPFQETSPCRPAAPS
jgi:hypothetical protein